VFVWTGVLTLAASLWAMGAVKETVRTDAK